MPHLITYNGTIDPDSHIDTYEWTTTSLKLNERFWCTYFPITLDGNVATWFKTLRTGSIDRFGQLKYLFLTNFMQLCKYKGDSHSIIEVKQIEGETIKDYFAQFTNATLSIPGHNEELVAGSFTWGLLSGPLSYKLMGKKPQMREKLKEKVERYIRKEEGEASKQVYHNVMAAPATKHHHPTPHNDNRGGNRYHRRDRGFRPIVRDYRRGWRAEVYTVTDKQAAKGTKTCYCEYQKIRRHDTINCSVLKRDMDEK